MQNILSRIESFTRRKHHTLLHRYRRLTVEHLRYPEDGDRDAEVIPFVINLSRQFAVHRISKYEAGMDNSVIFLIVGSWDIYIESTYIYGRKLVLLYPYIYM